MPRRVPSPHVLFSPLRTGSLDYLAARPIQLVLSFLLSAVALEFQLCGQMMLKPASEGEVLNLLPTDMAFLESSDQPRRDLPCTVTERKPDLGFDLRFHSGYDVSIPLSEVSGDSGSLTVIFRAYAGNNKEHASYFVQRFRLPAVPEEASGNAQLSGALDLGPGSYHFDWMMRDRLERICSSSWDTTAALPAKDRATPLLIHPNQVRQSASHPFFNEEGISPDTEGDGLNLKLMVNFAPPDSSSAAFSRNDTDALVSILKTIERGPHVQSLSLVAFNMTENRVIYRQSKAASIDFPALGRALETVHPGTVSVNQLNDKHSGSAFLEKLIETEVAPGDSDAVIFASPKTMLETDVPQGDLRRIRTIDCPVFYMNYNPTPQAVPWKDSISHAVRTFKGVEYTISRPRDLWVSTSEMFGRILRSRKHPSVPVAAQGTATGSGSLSFQGQH